MISYQVQAAGRAAVIQRARPAPESGEVIVEVGAVGVCGSDVEMVDGTRDAAYRRYPVVLGHEWAGRIVEVGDGVGDEVEGLVVGQYVAVEGHNYCGRCAECGRGATNLCETYDEFGFTRDGGYSPYVAARADLCHVFERVSSAEAALTEPASCALHGVLRSGVKPGDTALVVGTGTIGLLVVGLLALYSPRNLIAVGLKEEQREAALAMGATRYLVDGEDDVAEEVRRVSGGRGADVAFEAAGAPAAVRSALSSVARGGTLVLAGISGGSTAASGFDDLVFRDLRVEGVFAYTSSIFGRALGLIDSGALAVEPLIYRRMPLAEAEEAISLVREGKTIGKVLLEPKESEAER